MPCKRCHRSPCCCSTKVISKTGFRGPEGKLGKPGTPTFTVKDNTHTVANVREIRFTDTDAIVTDLGSGIAQVNFTPPATVWNDILNIPWYVSGSESFKPQYTIEGNRIIFRGLLYVPLTQGSGQINISNSNSYLAVPTAVIDETRLSIITNANTNNGTPQGRFMTADIVSAKNLPSAAIPVGRDITFNNVQAFRRYDASGHVTVYRSVVTLKIGSSMTVFKNGSTNIGSGCIMVFTPFNDEYDGAGNPPLGNDPLALIISRATGGTTAVDYISATDNNPFAIPSAGVNSPFDVNAHNISSLGGFIINLEGLFGYLN